MLNYKFDFISYQITFSNNNLKLLAGNIYKHVCVCVCINISCILMYISM